MSRYKIHIDPPNPDPDRVRSHENFDALFHEYRAARRFDFWRNLYRDPKVFAGLAAVVAIIFLVFQENDDPDAGEIFSRMGAPVAEALPPDQVWLLQADRDTTIALTDQLSLAIPAGSLLDSAGKPFSGSYELAFRLLEQPAEQFLSGASGARKPFRLVTTANGMELRPGNGIEFRSEQDDRELLAHQPDQWLAMNSLPDLTETTAGPGPRPQRPAILHELDEAGSKPVGPTPQRPGKPFGVQVDNLSDFPQFRGYRNVFWEYVAVGGYSDPWQDGLINDTMSQVRIRPFRDGAYELQFTRATADGSITRQSVIARPFLGVQTEQEVQDLYQDRLAEYQAELAQWEQARADKRRLEAEAESARTAWQQALADWEAAKQDTGTRTKTIHRWPVENFGYWGFAGDNTASDSVAVRIYQSIDHAGKAENLIRVFGYNPQTQQLTEARRHKDLWLLPNNGPGMKVWAYGRDHIWIGTVDETGSDPMSVTLELLPDHVKSTEDIVRHLQGVL